MISSSLPLARPGNEPLLIVVRTGGATLESALCTCEPQQQHLHMPGCGVKSFTFALGVGLTPHVLSTVPCPEGDLPGSPTLDQHGQAMAEAQGLGGLYSRPSLRRNSDCTATGDWFTGTVPVLLSISQQGLVVLQHCRWRRMPRACGSCNVNPSGGCKQYRDLFSQSSASPSWTALPQSEWLGPLAVIPALHMMAADRHGHERTWHTLPVFI